MSGREPWFSAQQKRVAEALAFVEQDADEAFGRDHRQIWQHAPVLAAEVRRLRTLAEHLFQMIPREAWRDTGGDDGQGHFEGDYRAEQFLEEIKAWAANSQERQA